MIIPNMVNKTSTVQRTLFAGSNPADRKSERHGRSPNKVAGGAHGHRIWLVHNLNFFLYGCPITNPSCWTSLFNLYVCAHVCVLAAQLVDAEKQQKFSWTAEDLDWKKIVLVLLCGRNPAEPISAAEEGCESHSFTDITTLLTLQWLRFWLMQWEKAWNIPQCEQRVLEEVRQGCVCVCVCEPVTWLTVKLCYWIVWLWWLHPDSAVQANRHLCQAACQE